MLSTSNRSMRGTSQNILPRLSVTTTALEQLSTKWTCQVGCYLFKFNMVLTFVSASTADADRQRLQSFWCQRSQSWQHLILWSWKGVQQWHHSDWTSRYWSWRHHAPQSARKKSISPKKSDDDGVSALVNHTSWLTMQTACYSPFFQFPLQALCLQGSELAGQAHVGRVPYPELSQWICTWGESFFLQDHVQDCNWTCWFF